MLIYFLNVLIFRFYIFITVTEFYEETPFCLKEMKNEPDTTGNKAVFLHCEEQENVAKY